MYEKYRRAPLLCVGATPEPPGPLHDETCGDFDVEDFSNVEYTSEGNRNPESAMQAHCSGRLGSDGDDWEMVG